MPDAADGVSSVPVAVLIDADNVAAEMLETVLAEAARFGRPTIRRVYGNWTGTELQGWKKLLHEHALQPVQQFAYVPGKNATDTALIIDAMDLLHGGQAQVFCLVSSDSDYTRLAMRLRESGKTVVGMGRAQTPKSLVKACDRFIALDTLAKGKQKIVVAAEGDGRSERGGGRRQQGRNGGGRERGGPPARMPPREEIELLRSAVEDAEGEDGWADVGGVGNILYANNPEFDPRNYGKRQLVALLESLGSDFEVHRPPEGQRGGSRVRLRN
ncbi:MAG TPA: NYN domain-containing protein [Candidatus Thermoplasmatota archaeon]|nr:NYN domain-containing protein [Candidatus Thermoplasmatota archaeon]